MEPTEYSILDGTTTPNNCETEPVHIPGCVLPHGVLLVLDRESFTPLQVSENCVSLGFPDHSAVLDSQLDELFEDLEGLALSEVLRKERLSTSTDWLGAVRVRGSNTDLDLIAHINEGLLYLELEPTVPPVRRLESRLRHLLTDLEVLDDCTDFCGKLSQGVQDLTGLDRVMVYRFAPDWSGEVIAESTSERTEERFLGHRFPAVDIPKPARDIYNKINMRSLPNSSASPAPLFPRRNPRTETALDMSYCVLRGASEMYTEYLENMGIVSSVTASIKRGGKLWGLLACHHNEEFHMSPQTKAAFELLSQIASLQLDAMLSRQNQRLAKERADICQQLSELTVEDKYEPDRLFDLMEALLDSDGVARYQGGRFSGRGLLPHNSDWEPFHRFLKTQESGGPPLFSTHSLKETFPDSEEWEKYPGGLLCVGLGHGFSDCLVWFREETTKHLKWGGNPETKNIQYGKHGPRLHPRGSFETYLEAVKGQCEPWSEEEEYLALNFLRQRQDRLRRRAAELAALNQQLLQANRELNAFAAIASHDLKEPLRGIANYANFLTEDYGEVVGDDGTHMLDRMKYLAVRMNSLLDALLEYSKLHTVKLVKKRESLDSIVKDALDSLAFKLKDGDVATEVQPDLPEVYGYPPFIETIVANLVSNAVKYNTSEKPRIEIGARTEPDGRTTFWVGDNGIGIPSEKLDRIFDIMVRLHHRESAFKEGSGLGLSIVKKMVDRHGGTIVVDSEPGKGSRFTVTL